MQSRKNPKIFVHHTIEIPDKRKKFDYIGEIKLVSYLRGKNRPHIEFQIYNDYKEYRNKGIMSKELPKYLKDCNRYGHNQLIAIVKEDNTPSIKLLEKNNFIKIGKIEDNLTYIIDLRFSKDHILKSVDVVNRDFPDNNFLINSNKTHSK